MKLHSCPKCHEAVDIKPLYDAVNFRGTIPKGHGLQCQNCESILKVSQRKRLAIMAIPLLLLIPFMWIEESSKLVRAIISVFVIALFFGPIFRFFPQLFEIKIAEPFEEIRVHDVSGSVPNVEDRAEGA